MRRKVTLKVFTPLLQQFESRLEALHMKRDSFLDHLIDRELPHLQSDLYGKRLSISARRFIAQSLKRLGTSQINVQLLSATAERLDDIARDTNLLRDSFINRLMYFSLGSDSLLRYFQLVNDKAVVHQDGIPVGCLQAIDEIQADPLANLRNVVKAKHGAGLYLAPLPVELVAFECYLDDETFWVKYGAPTKRVDPKTDLLLSFESTIYQSIPRRPRT